MNIENPQVLTREERKKLSRHFSEYTALVEAQGTRTIVSKEELIVDRYRTVFTEKDIKEMLK